MDSQYLCKFCQQTFELQESSNPEGKHTLFQRSDRWGHLSELKTKKKYLENSYMQHSIEPLSTFLRH